MTKMDGKAKARMSNGIAILLAGAMVAGALLLGPAMAQSNAQPADKVVAAGSKLVVFGPNAETTILTATMKTSSPTDLILSVALECSIFTQLVTGPSGDGGTDSATAAGHVRVWIEIDGQVVPVNSMSDTPQVTPPGGDESDKVTFCNRTYSRTVTDAEDPLDGQDVEDDFIDTKNANAYHWLRLNLGSGMHEIVVKATLLQETQGDATAQATIGNRALIVEPTKMANNAVI